jgi:hypothetical protein
MATHRSKYQTQWSAQFLLAGELSRRGYMVSFTIGNAPTIDLNAISPSGVQFGIQVKGLKRSNFWLFERVEPRNDLFFAFVLVPEDLQKSPSFFIMPSIDAIRMWDEYKDACIRRNSYTGKGMGINSKAPCPYNNNWKALPQ